MRFWFNVDDKSTINQMGHIFGLSIFYN